MNITQPFLAAKDPAESDLKFPLAVSDKRDGLRCIVGDLPQYGPCGLSRNFTPTRNKYVAKSVGELFPTDFDGELQVKTERGKEAAFRDTASGIQAFEGEPNYIFSVFDWGYSLTEPYERRVEKIKRWFDTEAGPEARLHGAVLDFTIVKNMAQLLTAERKALAAGFEGLILRDLTGVYKCGRSTLREGGMIKWVRKQRFECAVVGFVEEMANNNEAQKNPFGRTKRSSAKENKTAKNRLGALKVKMVEAPHTEFEVGTGFDATLRQQIWDDQDSHRGSICTIESRPYGGYDLPRFPVFIAFRDPSDM